jgi:hypothetical protein
MKKRISSARFTWVPPLAITYNKFTSFKHDVDLSGPLKDAFDEYNSNYEGRVEIPQDYSFGSPTKDFVKLIKAAKKWQYDRELSNIVVTIIQFDIAKRIYIQPNVSTAASKSVELLLIGGTEKSTPITLTQDQPKTELNAQEYLDGRHNDEIHFQSEFPELFILLSAEIKLKIKEKEMRLICGLWDILQLSIVTTTQKLKKHFGWDRPTRRYSVVLPSHSTWPGGHATSAAALVFLIDFVLQLKRPTYTRELDSLYNMAYRIAWNRERAGLHWSEDTTGGLKVGSKLIEAVFEILSKEPIDDALSMLK